MATYTIRDLEKLSGIKAHTIRIWEKRYSIIAPTRTATNIRNYCDSELKKLLNISLLNRNGLKISKLARLSDDEINEKINQLIQSYSDTESLVENLTIAMIELDQSIINPVQEHFITNLFRKKLMVAIDALITANNPNSKTFVLFLPEGEYHELGLLFFYYLVKRRGHKVIYLGQSVPFNDIIETKKLKTPDCLVTAFVSYKNGKDIVKYAKSMAEKFTEQTIYLSGNQTSNIQDKLPANVKIISSPGDFRNELNKIAPF